MARAKSPKRSINSAKRSLSPLRTVLLISELGLTELPRDEISPDRIGWKALGLLSVPSEWVPPFVVVYASCLLRRGSDAQINARIIEGLCRVGLSSTQSVLVRSSGTSETMQTRGLLRSESCSQSETVATIRNLIKKVPRDFAGEVHWIVQEEANPKKRGHLSNERHVRKENRDWLLEVEPQTGKPGYTVPIAIRRWRDGTRVTDLDMSCISELEISLRLKRVAMWATSLHSRIHFEWVWTGRAVRIVQAQEEDPATGVDPSNLIPGRISQYEPSGLATFRSANGKDYERYRKLRNARLYSELGYRMPPFYVMCDPKVMKALLSGRITPRLEKDLVELTKRPLVIRTDGLKIPVEKREMLPRSEELRSASQAARWLTADLRLKIKKSGLDKSELCLIAHHFIPSIASAWARAEPGKPIVRIESLWGIPEGLYWYSHDTYEVDTQTANIGHQPRPTSLDYNHWQRLRYKGTFVAADVDGKWLPHRTAATHDWKRSISRNSWLFEIAHTTKQVAEYEKQAISLMWFIDNHREATSHRVLPWFHNRSDVGNPKAAAPRRKLTTASEVTLRNANDWQRLRNDLESGKRIERIVVEPEDPDLIRDREFAEELGGLAAKHGCVVELAGGILSHAYYVLRRSGAQVECVDLFGTDEDTVEYNKLVRDKVPELIENRGERVKVVRLAGDALVKALQQKLVEEAFEALDARSGQELVGELADVQEVISALCRALQIPITQVELEQDDKLARRGGFSRGLMIKKTATPHSIQKEADPPEPPILALTLHDSDEDVIANEESLPEKPFYRRPDLRQVEQQIEKLFAFETETNRIGKVKQTLNFSMPIEGQDQPLSLTVELQRTGSSVRGVVRLRSGPTQLELEFPEPQLKLEFME